MNIKTSLLGSFVAALAILTVPQIGRADTQPASDLASLVNPMVGTDRSGDIFPGAVAPFGMMQLSPNLGGNGYYYTDNHMHGFVLNLMSGNGGSDEGEVLMTATTGPVKIDRASTDFNFDHQHETASAGYYQVQMQPWNINAEMTTTTRCGMLRYTFPAGKQANILLPLSYTNNATLSSDVHYVDNQTVTGHVTSQAFNGYQNGIPVYFVMKFSKPFDSHGTWTNTTVNENSGDAAQTDRNTVIGFYGSYPASQRSETVEVRIGMSYVSVDGAIKNLNAEMPGNTFGEFDRYHKLAVQAWDKELSLIDAQGGTLTHRRIFYTAMYHALIAPTTFEDVDGRYTGFDGAIHTVTPGHKHYYATFSGWDIYRSEIPLLGIIEPERAGDMAQSIVEMAKQLGYIDRWPQLNQATSCMNGDPLTICLVNLWDTGIRNFDMDTAYSYMWKQCLAGDPHSHIGVYQPYDEEKGGVTLNADASPSTALEYDVSFAALGHLAQELNKTDDANYLFARAFQYRDMYNPDSGYLQGKNAKGLWDATFGNYTEGNRDIYLWFVPEDVEGLVDLMGGAPVFDKRLDAFFDNKQYDPTNEPDLQAPFLYDYINRPWKAQHIVADTADQNFADTPGGLAGGGNDDLGTMSAWYILSQLGFYPVDPGIPYFEVCTPRFSRVVIHLTAPHAGKEFVIEAPQAAPNNEYIQSAILNGKTLNQPWFGEDEILSGGTWNVQLGAQPNMNWGSSPSTRPYSLSTGFNHIPNNPVVHQLAPSGKDEPVIWKYTMDKPANDWSSLTFNDSGWNSGPSGFGTEDEGVAPRTVWNKDDIWMRRTVTLTDGFHSAAISAYHDQDLDVYINGIFAAHVDGYTHSYDNISISNGALSSLHAGENLLAVHVHHPGDGRHFADAGLVELEWPESEK